MWDGVKSPQHKKYKSMQPKDLASIYHTGKERSLTGVAEIITRPYPDPKETGLYVIDLAPVYRLKRPVSLAEIKQDHFSRMGTGALAPPIRHAGAAGILG